jgi:diguanylate cyclase (GGDEF)-like protein
LSAQIFPGTPPLPCWHALVGIVLAADFILILSSFLYGTVFYFENDIYYRGPYFLMSMALLSSSIFISAAMLIRYRTHVEKKYFKGLLLYPLPPILAFFCQLAIQDFPFIPCAAAFSIIMIYLNIQNRIMDVDFLTGAYTRRRLNQHMERKIRQAKAGHTFAAVMIDLDNFKKINDSFGHIAGDRVLQKTVAIIKACIRHNDFIARYGGDEFCLVLDVSRQEDLDAVINRICQAFYNQNRRRDDQETYDLNFSMGYDFYDPASHMNLHQFQHHIDEIMYENKKNKRPDTKGMA